MTRNDAIPEEQSDHFAQNRNYFLTFTVGIIALLAFAMTGPTMPNPSQFFAAVGGSTLSAPVLSGTGVSCVSGLPNVGFSWTQSAGASTYTLQRKLASSDAWVGALQGGITGTTYVDALWQRDFGAQTYYYRIAAVNAVSRSYSVPLR